MLEGLFRIFFKLKSTGILKEINQTTRVPESKSPDEDLIHPCCEKLQHLENLVSELTKRPARIPPEKDEILLESMNRIKSIEHDLQKTKKVTYDVLLIQFSRTYAKIFYPNPQVGFIMPGIASYDIKTSGTVGIIGDFEGDQS